MQELIKNGLSLVRKEYILHDKIMNSALEHDEEAFNYFSSLYKDLSKSTDKICDQLIENENLQSLFTKIEKEAGRYYGKDGQKYFLFLAGVLSQSVQNKMSDQEYTAPSLVVEEIKNVYHNMLLDKCDISNKFVKDMVSTNIFSSLSLRKLMGGDVDSYNNLCEYKCQLSSDMFMVCNEAVFSLAIGTMEVLNYLSARNGVYLKDDNMNMQFLIEKLKLSAIYVVAKKRGFDIRISSENLNKLAIDAISDAANYGEEYASFLGYSKRR